MRDIFTLLVLLFAIVATPLAAQETKLGEDGADSPPATLADVTWLVGQWEGAGIGGARAVESWLPSSGGTMVGTFVQESDEGTIRFTEHLYLMEEDGTLVLRLKHFNADLTGWEEKDDMLAFRLVDIEPCTAFFRGLTLRCANPDRPGEGLVAAVRIRSEGDEVRELVFRFDAMARPADRSYGCDGSTYVINQCLGTVRDRALAREKFYFDTSMAGSGGDEVAQDAQGVLMRAAQNAAEQYRQQVCAAVYKHWEEGSIRNAMALRCEIELIDERTHTIWQNWLTHQGPEPILPEPMPTQTSPPTR